MRDSKKQLRHRRVRQTPVVSRCNDDDPNAIPRDIMRVAMDVMNVWRECLRPACKRGRACRGGYVQCLDEGPPAKRSNNAEKDARDRARARAIFQRQLRERAALVDEITLAEEAKSASQTKARPRRKRRE